MNAWTRSNQRSRLPASGSPSIERPARSRQASDRQRVLRRLQRDVRTVQQLGARLRQLHAAGRADQQRRTDLALQLLHLA